MLFYWGYAHCLSSGVRSTALFLPIRCREHAAWQRGGKGKAGPKKQRAQAARPGHKETIGPTNKAYETAKTNRTNKTNKTNKFYKINKAY